jgi:excisionase family DNA binding protein
VNKPRPASSSSESVFGETTEDRLLKAEEVAAMLAVSTRFVREHTRSGAIPHLKLGERYVRYRRESVLAWLDQLEQGGRVVQPRKHAPALRNGGTK